MRSAMVGVEQGKTLRNIDFRFAPFKKGTWRNYTTLDGLAIAQKMIELMGGELSLESQ